MAIRLRERLKNTDCHEKKMIAKEFGICYRLLLKYNRMTDEEVDNLDKIRVYKKRKTKMDNYSNIIYKMLKDGIEHGYIFTYVKKMGCTASDRYILDYINLVSKNNGFKYKKRKNYIKMIYPENITVITRYELLKYLLTLDKKKNNNQIIENNIKIIFEKYPIAKEIQTVFRDFHYVMFSADIDNLDIFIELYNKLIPGFCNGIKKDIAAIKNAISFEINSGFVEGNNNKFKLIKRIVYGKPKLVNLLKRCYVGFMLTLDNFDISLIVEDILNS